MLSHTESFFLINTHYYTMQNLIVHSSQPLYRKTPGKFIITAINIISELIRESYDPHRQRETAQGVSLTWCGHVGALTTL